MGFPDLSQDIIRAAKKNGEDKTYDRFAALVKGTKDKTVRLNALYNLSKLYETMFESARQHFSTVKKEWHRDDTPENENEYAKVLFGCKAGMDMVVALGELEGASRKKEFSDRLTEIFRIRAEMTEYMRPYDITSSALIRGRRCIILETGQAHPQ